MPRTNPNPNLTCYTHNTTCIEMNTLQLISPTMFINLALSILLIWNPWPNLKLPLNSSIHFIETNGFLTEHDSTDPGRIFPWLGCLIPRIISRNKGLVIQDWEVKKFPHPEDVNHWNSLPNKLCGSWAFSRQRLIRLFGFKRIRDDGWK